MSKQEYWNDIRSMAREIMDEAIEADPQDPECGIDLHDRAHEAVDGCEWVIFTHKALRVMEYTDNDAAYEDLGAIPTGKGWPTIVAYCAFWAMRADLSDAVRELLDAYEPPEDEDEDDGSALLGQVEQELARFGMKQMKPTTLRESTGYDEGEALVYFSATKATPAVEKWIDSLHSKYGHKIDVSAQGIGSDGVLWTIAETPKG